MYLETLLASSLNQVLFGDFEKNGDQKTHFGPHGNQSPQMGTNVGAVELGELG